MIELVAYIAVAGIWKMLLFMPSGMHFLKLLMAVKNIHRRASNPMVATANGFKRRHLLVRVTFSRLCAVTAGDVEGTAGVEVMLLRGQDGAQRLGRRLGVPPLMRSADVE